MKLRTRLLLYQLFATKGGVLLRIFEKSVIVVNFFITLPSIVLMGKVNHYDYDYDVSNFLNKTPP